jgi:hypothetical protein
MTNAWSFIKMKSVDIDTSFQHPIDRMYPAHQQGMLIEEFAQRFFAGTPDKSDWIYIPVNWTGWFCNHNYGKNTDGLRQYLRSLRLPHGKYFTVVQNDDGTLCDDILHEIGCTIFGCGGVGDVPLPLLCDPHPITMKENPTHLASFIGSFTTHPIRRAMREILQNEKGFFFGQGGTSLFGAVMTDSKYALCPRGYGRTSYRLYEALRIGCVPIYIYDEPWLPMMPAEEWLKFCLLIDTDMINLIPDILRGIPEEQYASMRARGREVCRDYFNFKSTCEWIYKWLA